MKYELAVTSDKARVRFHIQKPLTWYFPKKAVGLIYRGNNSGFMGDSV